MPAEEIVGSEESEAQGINQKISFGAARWLAGLLVVVCKWEKVECRVGGADRTWRERDQTSQPNQISHQSKCANVHMGEWGR